MNNVYYKVAKPDGFDFRTGRTINYKENVGKTVYCPKNSRNPMLCTSTVLHASSNLLHALSYANIPCTIFKVTGTPVVSSYDKHGFKQMKVEEQLSTKNLKKAINKLIIEIMTEQKLSIRTGKRKKLVKEINKILKILNNPELYTLDQVMKIKKNLREILWSKDEKKLTRKPIYISQYAANYILSNNNIFITSKNIIYNLSRIIEMSHNTYKNSKKTIKLYEKYSKFLIKNMQ